MAGAPPPGLDRKRGPGDFGGGGDGGWRKRPRFDEAGVPPATLRVLVRNQDAGGIIGKGGENIKRLRKQYDCQVMLPDSAGAPERVMTMMGGIESCLGVFADVINTLGLDSGLGDNAHKEVQILIPQPFMGTIIGTGGAKIKELRGRTSAKIKIFMEPMPNSNERSIQIIGVHDQIVDCTRHFLQEIGKVRKKEPREPIFLYEPGAPSFGGDFPPPGRGGFPGRGRGGGGGPSRGQGNFGGDGGGGNWRGGRGGGRGRGGRGGRGRGGMNGGQRGGGGYNQSNQFNPNPPQGGSFGPGGGGNPPPAVGYSQAPPPSVGYDQQPPPMGGPPPMPQGMGAGGGQPPAFPQPPQLLSQQPPPRQTQQVTIPSEYAEAIMGVGGSNLVHIKSQSNCDINIDPPKPGTNERIITIIGGSADIARAQQLLQKSVRDKFPNV